MITILSLGLVWVTTLPTCDRKHNGDRVVYDGKLWDCDGTTDTWRVLRKVAK